MQISQIGSQIAQQLLGNNNNNVGQSSGQVVDKPNDGDGDSNDRHMINKLA